MKDLTNKDYCNTDLRTQIIFCGTDETYGILEAAHWIQGRTYTIRLDGLSRHDYSQLLHKIYRDYVKLGISEDWNLLYPDPRTQIMTLDRTLSEFLFDITGGKVGLTEQIVKKTLTYALTNNRAFPLLEDFKLTIALDKDLAKDISSFKQKRKKNRKKAVITYLDLKCKIKGCSEYNVPFESNSDLLNHYKVIHPEYTIINKENHKIR